MFFNTYATKLAQKDSGSIASRIKVMMAFVIAPAGRQAPAPEELARLTSPTNKYCTGVVELLETSVSLFRGRSIGGNRGSGLARSKPVQGVQGVCKPDEPMRRASANPDDVIGLIDDFLDDLENEPEEPSHPDLFIEGDASGQLHVHSSTSHEFSLLAIAPLAPGRLSQSSDVAASHTSGSDVSDEDSDLVEMIDNFLQDLEEEPLQPVAPVVQEPTPSVAQPGLRTTRYADQRTLPVPVVNHNELKHPLPTTAELRTRRLWYKLDRVRFKHLRYTPCELAHRGIYLHDPVGHSERVDTDFSPPRLHREAWVGPLKRHRVWAGQEAGRPRLQLTPPNDRDMDVAVITGASVDSASSSEPSKPVTSVEAPEVVASPVSSNNPQTPTQPSRPLEPTGPARDTPAAQEARKMRDRHSSMSNWLIQFGCGFNMHMLVDDRMVVSSVPVIDTVMSTLSPSPVFLRSSSPSSSSPPSPLLVPSALSSPQTSPPTTPVSSPETSFVVLAQDNDSVRSSSNYRRRARCSYDGGKSDEVVAPVLPEELLTDEVGVAC